MINPANVMRTGEEELALLRAQSRYRTLRDSINIIAGFLMVCGVIAGLLLLLSGISSGRSTDPAEYSSGWLLSAIGGILVMGFSVLAGLVWKQAASLLVDVADALIELCRRGRR